MSIKKTHMELGERLKSLKNFWQLSQKEMAERLEIAISTYQYYERGERDVPGKILTIIASFGVSPVWLLTGNGDMLQSDIKDAITEKPVFSVLLKPLDIESVTANNEAIEANIGDGSFSERLGTLIRERLDISQSEFCEKIGLTPGYLSMIIKGKRGPSADLISGVYIHYRDYFHWLITGTEDDGIPKTYTDRTVQEHIEIVKKFKNQERAKKINEQLVLLEKLNPSELNEMVDYVSFKVEKNLKASGSSGSFSLSEGNLKNGTEE